MTVNICTEGDLKEADMSCNYAEGLSPYYNKGKLGLKEKFDSKEEVVNNVVQLAEWISNAKHIVVHTGAGISTSAGIPDFRGPKGVWTLEEKGLKPEINISFDEAVPTKTHMALTKLIECGKVQYIVSQNIDGLHLRSGIPRTHLAELHGNMFTEKCSQCELQFVRQQATTTVGQKCLEIPCPASRRNGRPCRGRLHDTILDWEHNLPENDLGMADFHSCIADLSICLGTTLQIVPSGNLPLYTKKFGGRLVICNLQPTKHDRKADLIIHSYVDDVMVQLMKLLDQPIPEYCREKDPTKFTPSGSDQSIDWTISDSSVKVMRTIYESKCCKQSRKRGIKTEAEEKHELNFKQVKKIKPKEESDNGITHAALAESDSFVKTEVVSEKVQCKKDKTVKDGREQATANTNYEITDNDNEPSETILEHVQNLSFSSTSNTKYGTIGKSNRSCQRVLEDIQNPSSSSINKENTDNEREPIRIILDSAQNLSSRNTNCETVDDDEISQNILEDTKNVCSSNNCGAVDNGCEPTQIILENTQNLSSNDHIHANVGIIEVKS